MKLVITSLSVATIVASFLMNNITQVVKLSQNVNNEVAVLSAQISSSPQPVKEIKSNASSVNDNNYYYPNSKIIEAEDGKIVMEVEADPVTVTAWYKDLLQVLDLPVNSTVTATTNGRVDNKLVSSSAGKKVEVEITKYPDSAIVFIHVNY